MLCNEEVNCGKITLEECTEIVRRKFKSENYEIINFQLIGLSEKNGFLGDHQRLLISVRKINESVKNVHCFAKFLPENQSQNDFAVNCGVFEKEVFVYDELFPRITNLNIDYLSTCVAKCYLSEINRVLVFEDVTERGFKSISKFSSLDYHHVVVVLKEMAKLHASSLIFEEILSNQLNKKYRLLDNYSKNFFESFFVDDLAHKGGQGVRAALKGIYTGFTLFPEENFDILDEKFRKKVDEVTSNIYKLVKPSKKYRNVICHGDLWVTNIMVKYQDDQPIESILLDFQTIRYCPPGHDFMSFLYLTTSSQFREQHSLNLQRFYYSELEKLLFKHKLKLNDIISFKEFVDSCEEQKNFAIIQHAIYVQLINVKDDMLQEYSNDLEKWETYLYIDRSGMVIENCEKDPEYREVIKDSLKDLQEFCNSL